MTFDKTPKFFKGIEQLAAIAGSKDNNGFTDCTLQYISSSLKGLLPAENLHPFHM